MSDVLEELADGNLEPDDRVLLLLVQASQIVFVQKLMHNHFCPLQKGNRHPMGLHEKRNQDNSVEKAQKIQSAMASHQNRACFCNPKQILGDVS